MRLNVPYHSQEAQDAKHFTNDCGAACASMVIEWAGLGRPSVDSLAIQTNLRLTDSAPLSPMWVQKLLTDNGIPAEMRTSQSADSILRQIDQSGAPVIAFIFYDTLPNRPAFPDWFGGHYVVVLGQENGRVYVNDPDFWGSTGEQGKNFSLSKEEFARAITRPQMAGTVIVVTQKPATLPPREIKNSEPETTTRPAVRSLPPGDAYVVNDPLWLRAAPAGAQIRLLAYNDHVVIQNTPPVSAVLNGAEDVWVRVLVEGVAEGWCLGSGLRTR